MIRDRLSWMRFLRFDPGGPTPDENTMAVPEQIDRDRPAEAGDEGVRPDEPHKAAQKDTDARWTLKIGGKIRYGPDGTPLPQIALPVFGYKSHIAIDRRFGFIRESAVTSAAQADGRMLPRLVSTENSSSEVWADSAYRSQTNEKWLASRMLASRIHRRKPAGKPMPRHVARANAAKSSIRFGLFIRTIGLARAEGKLILANIAYNFDRVIFHERARAMGWLIQTSEFRSRPWPPRPAPNGVTETAKAPITAGGNYPGQVSLSQARHLGSDVLQLPG